VPANAADVVLRRVGHRIAELRALRGWTQEEFAERIGVSPQYVQAVEGGRENLTLRTLAALAEALRIHPAGLLFAPTTPRAKPGRPSGKRRRPFEEVEPEAAKLFKSCVPLVTLKAAAGSIGEPRAVEAGRWVVPKTRVRLAPGMFVAQVAGDSMEPSIPDGAWALFRSPAREVDGRIVLVQVRDPDDPDSGGAFLLKKVERRRVRSAMRVRLLSRNKKYPPIDVSDDRGERYTVIAELVEVLSD